MQRRKFITAASGAMLTVVAGCGDTDEYEEGGNQAGNGDNDEDTLELVDHELVIERGEYTDDVTIEGTVRNNSDEQESYVEVKARVYNEEGQQLDSYFTNTTDLGAGKEWPFEIMVLEEPDDVAEYDIQVSDSAF